jgi:hypothetical protein
LFEYPSNPDRLMLAATFGLVTSNDGGKSWYYICETAFSFYPPPPDPGFTADPLLALMADDTIVLGAEMRITKSTDAACGWTRSFDEPGKIIDDVAVAPSDRTIAVALVRTTTSSPAVSQVYETRDSGTTWRPIGSPITNIALGYTIDVDPKDPRHLMVTGITTYTPGGESGVFLNSTNGGMTWASSPIPKTNIDASPYIAAVHPMDGNKVFVRTHEWPENDVGGYDARDALLYTKDGGQTWTELLRPIGVEGAGGKLFGFALSPDGATVLAGYGDPVDGSGRIVDRTLTGVYKSTGPDYSFGATPMPIFSDLVTCLTWTAKGIYVCASPDGGVPYIAFANDINNVTKAGLAKIMEVDKMKGEPPCCAGRAVTACEWPSECLRFGACGDGGTPLPPGPDAAVCMMMPEAGPDVDASRDADVDQSAGGAGGMAGASGMGGAGRAGSGGATAGGAGTSGSGGAGTSGSGGAATGGASGVGTGGTGGSDCSCRTAATTRERSVGAVSLLLALVGAGGWRRSRRRRESAASTL